MKANNNSNSALPSLRLVPPGLYEQPEEEDAATVFPASTGPPAPPLPAEPMVSAAPADPPAPAVPGAPVVPPALGVPPALLAPPAPMVPAGPGIPPALLVPPALVVPPATVFPPVRADPPVPLLPPILGVPPVAVTPPAPVAPPAPEVPPVPGLPPAPPSGGLCPSCTKTVGAGLLVGLTSVTIRLSNRAVVLAAVPSPTLPLAYLVFVMAKTCVPSTEPLIELPWKTSFRLCQLPAARVACPLVTAAAMPRGDFALVIASALALLRPEQTLHGRCARSQLGEVAHGSAAAARRRRIVFANTHD